VRRRHNHQPVFRAAHPSRVAIIRDTPEGRASGLLTDSVVMTDNLATITEATIGRAIGSLRRDAVDTALRHTLGL
jgi:mRNA interferase MazF